MFAGQIQFSDVPQTDCPGVMPFDYDCDGKITNFGQYAIDRAVVSCDQIPLADCSNQILWRDDPGDNDLNVIPQCGAMGVLIACDSSFQGVPQGRCASIAGDTIINRCR